MPRDRRPRLVLLRHGETQWSASGRHTGRTDVPLTETGRAQAVALAGRLPLDGPPSVVLSSPSSRAVDTAALAGFPAAETDPDLREWDYGDMEGRTTAELRAEHPGWDVWHDGVTGGETVDQVGARADRVIGRCAERSGACLLVAHAHLLRILAARWLGLPATDGRLLLLDPAHWSVLTWQRETAVIDSWNVA